MKLVAVISVLALTAALTVLLVFRSPGPAAPGSQAPGFHTEIVPAQPLIEIFPVGTIERADLKLIADSIASAFKVRTRVVSGMALPEPARNDARNQYSADWVLRVAAALKSEGAFRTLLVIEADIYSGDLPYILFLNSPDAKMALISIARLGGVGRVELGLEQVRKRTRGLAIRALAASLGIRRCDNDCILASRPTLENLDRMPRYFCPQCANALQDKLQTGIGSPHAHFQSALLYLEDGSIDGAIEELRKAIALKHDYLAAQLNLAELYLQKGWHAEAITTLRKAAALAPRNPEPRTRLAQVLLLNSQADAALEELTLALTIDPDSRETHRLLGITYQFYLGDAERARAHYRKFLDLGGDPAQVDRLLDYSREQPREGSK